MSAFQAERVGSIPIIDFKYNIELYFSWSILPILLDGGWQLHRYINKLQIMRSNREAKYSATSQFLRVWRNRQTRRTLMFFICNSKIQMLRVFVESA